MIVSRICKSAHINLSGAGAELYGGRWNSPGRAVVYAASCGALATLEYLVHVNDLLSTHLYVVRIEIPDTLSKDEIQYVPATQEEMRKLGDEWLERATAPLLYVPSVIVPYQRNVLINPNHALAAAIRIRDKTPFVYDRRLLAT